MWVLGFDTSNYATSLAVFDTCAGEVVYDKKKFLPVKPGHLGLRQSDAVFHHTEALHNSLPDKHAQARGRLEHHISFSSHFHPFL